VLIEIAIQYSIIENAKPKSHKSPALCRNPELEINDCRKQCTFLSVQVQSLMPKKVPHLSIHASSCQQYPKLTLPYMSQLRKAIYILKRGSGKWSNTDFDTN
jgi:hypothetical protein